MMSEKIFVYYTACLIQGRTMHCALFVLEKRPHTPFIEIRNTTTTWIL